MQVPTRKKTLISTLRHIIKTVKRLEGCNRENVIGIITTRGALDTVRGKFDIGEIVVKNSEYPATIIEEEII